MSDTYGYDESFRLHILAAFIRKPKEMKGLVEPEYFDNPVFADIAGIAKEVQENPDTRNTELTKPILKVMVQDFLKPKKDRDDLWPLYRKVVRKIFKMNMNSLPLLRNEAIAFAKNVKYRQAIILCEKDISNRKYDNVHRRIAELKAIGHTEQDVGLSYWKNLKDPSRVEEDRFGIVPTGYFRLLDKAMCGGVGAGEVAIIEGGGKSGKSTFLGRIAAGAAKERFNVAVASGELSAFKYRKRLDSMHTGIPYSQLTPKDGDTSHYKEVYHRLRASRRACKGEIQIKEFPTGKAKIQEIGQWLDRLEDCGFKTDMLVVDYLALFKPDTGFGDRRLDLGQCAVDLRGLAVERKIAIWTAAQVNRAGLDKPMLGPADLAEDISQFFTLDFLIAICQEKKERLNQEERKKGLKERARLVLVAARDVASGAIIGVELQRNTFTVREVSYSGWEDNPNAKNK